MDANNIKWDYPDTLMNETDHAVYYTLQQYYDSKDNTQVSSLLLISLLLISKQ